jgi:vibriolysin
MISIQSRRISFAPLVALAFVLLSAGSVLADDPRGLTSDQIAQLRGFPAVHQFEATPAGIPTFISGRLGFIGFGPIERNAPDFVSRLLPLFHGAGEERFRLLRTERDKAGAAHVRLEEQYRGLSIVGAELIIHVNESTGEVTGVNGRFVPAVGLAVTPTIDSGTAIANALREAAIASPEVLEKPYLTYVLDQALAPRLAWATTIAYRDEQGFEKDRIFADARSGELVAKHGLIWPAKFRQIYDAQHTTSLPGTFLFQEGGSSTDTDAQDAYDYTGNAYDYYAQTHGRDSWDAGGGTLTSTVHYDSGYNNAYWSGSQLVFGDGDGSTFTGFARALDVVAHEMTHGVTQATANLTYSNESGALNESMSDIFGAATEAYVRGQSSNTWKIGEDIYTPGVSGDALRYMDNPTLDGASKDYYPQRYTGSQDNGGVHWNSGIGNLAFYLLSQGGTHPRGATSVYVSPLGMYDASRIFYRALTSYMTSSTQFADARTTTAKAAIELFGPCSSQLTSVHAAWEAVGVSLSSNTGADLEPNDSPSQANSLPGLNNAVTGGLCSSGNEDWFAIYKSSSYSALNITLYPPADADYDLELWQNGTRSVSHNTGNGVSESIYWPYDSGTMYIRVLGKNGASSSNSYTMYFYQ